MKIKYLRLAISNFQRKTVQERLPAQRYLMLKNSIPLEPSIRFAVTAP